MKKIRVKEVEPIAIEFTDKTYICSFTMRAVATVQEELGELDGTLKDVSPSKMASIILYAGLKENHPEITREETNALIMQMGPAVYGDLLKEWNDSFYDSMGDTDKSMLKKQMAQLISNARK